MALPGNLDGGRAIVIEDVPPGTGIADLIGAFSAYGPIRFASVGPPAVVIFEMEASAAHALLVASMKSVSLLTAFREKKPAPTQATAFQNHPPPSSALSPPLGVSTETEISSNEASPSEIAATHAKMSPMEAVPPAEAAAPEMKTSPNEVQPPIREKNLEVSAPAQPAASRSRPWPSRTPAEVAASQTKVNPIEAAPPAEAVSPDKKTSQVQVQPPVREKKLQVPAPAPAQPATCCNHPPSSPSMASASENTEISSITGRLIPAPRKERRLPLLRSVASSVATLTEDEYYYNIVRAFLGGFFFFSFLIIPIFTAPEVFP